MFTKCMRYYNKHNKENEKKEIVDVNFMLSVIQEKLECCTTVVYGHVADISHVFISNKYIS